MKGSLAIDGISIESFCFSCGGLTVVPSTDGFQISCQADFEKHLLAVYSIDERERGVFGPRVGKVLNSVVFYQFEMARQAC